MNRTLQRQSILLAVLAIAVGTVWAVDSANGTAIVRVADVEHTIPVVCDDTSQPAAGVYTEAQRVMRERTGRTSRVRLNIRPWKDTAEIIVSFDRYVAWAPLPPASDGVLVLLLTMSPASFVRDGKPVAMTYEEWTAGSRPAGLAQVDIEVNCRTLDPAAPAFRKLPATG